MAAGKVDKVARAAKGAAVWAQGGDVLTASTGTPVDNTDNSLPVVRPVCSCVRRR